MQKTAIRIDRDLADRAQQVLGTATLTATVNRALEDAVRVAAHRDLVRFFRERQVTPEELDEIDKPDVDFLPR